MLTADTTKKDDDPRKLRKDASEASSPTDEEDLEQLQIIHDRLGLDLASLDVSGYNDNVAILSRLRENDNAHDKLFSQLSGQPQEVIDILSRMLTTDPRKRVSAADLLRLPYFGSAWDRLRSKHRHKQINR
jgi:serine/threonine protein kinase